MRTIGVVLGAMLVAITGIVAGAEVGDVADVPAEFAELNMLDQGHNGVVISATGNVVTVTNIGPDLRDLGGLKIVANGTVVGTTPYTMMLGGTMSFGRDQSRVIVLSENVTPGVEIVLTNGVGVYAKGVAQ